jgi:FMN phosphatase YigB (HAD superfamily)
MMGKIKNIIFDLGGVIYNIDYQLSIDAFKNLGISNFKERYSQTAQSALFDDFETGKISPEQFREGIRLESGLPLSKEQIDHAWNAMLLNMPPNRVDLLRLISGNYRIFLLSNTNAIHIPLFNAQVNAKFGDGVFHSIFRKVYFSYLMGMRKPDRKIFEFLMNENQLLPHETFFIDDSLQHVEGAVKTGIEAYWLKPGLGIEDIFSSEGRLNFENSNQI